MPMNSKPSRPEDEYFAKHDAELMKERRARLDAERQNAERKAHWMKCPKCGADLKERTFHHMKIDVCPDCGGTFLDKGELEMLTHVNRSNFSRFIGDMLGLGDK
jgi:uncharacterized C2H2 Zn-finger protein